MKTDDIFLIPNPIACLFPGCHNLTIYGIIALTKGSPEGDIMVNPVCVDHLRIIEKTKRGFGACPNCQNPITLKDVENEVNAFKLEQEAICAGVASSNCPV